MRFDSLLQFQLFRCCLIHSGCLCRLGNSSLQNLQIRKDQFQIDCLNITYRIDLSIYMDNIRIFKTTNYMDNRIHLTNIRQKLVTKTFTFGSALYQTCNIHKLNHRRSHLLGMIKIS